MTKQQAIQILADPKAGSRSGADSYGTLGYSYDEHRAKAYLKWRATQPHLAAEDKTEQEEADALSVQERIRQNRLRRESEVECGLGWRTCP